METRLATRRHAEWLGQALGLLDEEKDLLGKIAPYLELSVCAPGEAVVKEGEPGDDMFVLFSGAARVFREDGAEGKPLARLQPGNFFGEMAMLESVPRTATVAAEEPSELIRVRGAEMRRALAGDPKTLGRLKTVARRRFKKLEKEGGKA